jgi:hypothetical protein
LCLLLGACAGGQQAPDPAATRAHAASVAEVESRSAVAVVGARVCRRFTIGIGNYDWVSGVVIAVDGEFVTVQVDKPGRLSLTHNGVLVVRGAKLRDPSREWTLCG